MNTIKHIDETDHYRAGLYLIECTEVEGRNPFIEKMRGEAYTQLREFFKDVDSDWLINFIQYLRQDIRNKMKYR